MDIRQSSLYASFMKKIGWDVVKIKNSYLYTRNILFIGKIAKFQRTDLPIPFDKLTSYTSLTIEPDLPPNKILEAQFIANGYRINLSPYLPTKTILIDLTQTEDKIFKSFAQAKRRSIRKAVKNKVKVIESDNIESFIKLKSSHMFPIGFLMAKEIQALWTTFYPNNASLLMAQGAGILLLFYSNKAYYWLAASTKEGNKLAAPSLLVWEALKLAKKKGATSFDFEGIYDSRFHQATKNWQGFTKFKRGFGGKELNFIGSFKI